MCQSSVARKVITPGEIGQREEEGLGTKTSDRLVLMLVVREGQRIQPREKWKSWAAAASSWFCPLRNQDPVDCIAAIQQVTGTEITGGERAGGGGEKDQCGTPQDLEGIGSKSQTPCLCGVAKDPEREAHPRLGRWGSRGPQKPTESRPRVS